MKKQKTYTNVRFPPNVIKEAYQSFAVLVKPNYERELRIYKIQVGNEEWFFDSEEEFFIDYRRDISSALYRREYLGALFELCVAQSTSIVTIQAEDRNQIQAIFEMFETNIQQSIIKPGRVEINDPTIFIGHGRSNLWKELKDHLQDKHSFKVDAYEVGSRAGHTIRDILESMLEQSSFALLVMTGEDETKDGTMRARQNVIHEIGLFQGRLGFSKAIVLREEGTEDFSNNSGIQYIQFSKGNIKETFGDVLAVIRREFPSNVLEHINKTSIKRGH